MKIEEETAPRNLAELVAYQEAAVVSKTLIRKETGTVTLFAFDRGQDLSEHTSPFDAMVYLLEGTAEIIASGTAHLVNQGEMILLPAHQPHALKAVDPFKMLLILIKST